MQLRAAAIEVIDRRRLVSLTLRRRDRQRTGRRRQAHALVINTGVTAAGHARAVRRQRVECGAAEHEHHSAPAIRSHPHLDGDRGFGRRAWIIDAVRGASRSDPAPGCARARRRRGRHRAHPVPVARLSGVRQLVPQWTLGMERHQDAVQRLRLGGQHGDVERGAAGRRALPASRLVPHELDDHDLGGLRRGASGRQLRGHRGPDAGRGGLAFAGLVPLRRRGHRHGPTRSPQHQHHRVSAAQFVRIGN